MSVTKTLVTPNFNHHNVETFIKSFDDNDYFMYFGRHLPYEGGDGLISETSNSVNALSFDTYNNMMFSKRINKSDTSSMIHNYSWSSGTVYSEYDHRVNDLLEKKFYTVVNDTSEYNVYKCLFNNNDSESTVAPSRVGSSSDLSPITTGDGYVWKYMYTISKTDYDKFASRNYIPVVANNSVSENAVGGTIEVIKIDSAGSGYDNYISSSVFKSGDISVNGNKTLYGAPETAEIIDDFYKGCAIKITSGAGINQYRKIVNYTGSGSQRIFTLEEEFTVEPKVGDSYVVYPYVYVWGDGSESIGADGIATIESTSNSIVDIEILNVGKGYRSAQSYAGQMPLGTSLGNETVFVDVPTVLSASENFAEAQLSPIISPPNGHGYDSSLELGAKRACLSIRLSNSEGGTIPTENDFRQIGIIKNPMFDNVKLSLDGNTEIGSFSIGETICRYNQIKLAGSVDITSGNSTVLMSNFGKISSSAQILSQGSGYDSTLDNNLVFDNTGTGGSGAAGTFANDVNGSITSVTITSTGTGYMSAPIASINSTASGGGSEGQVGISLANPDIPTYNEVFEEDDYVLINKELYNLVGKVSSSTNNYSVVLQSNSDVTLSNCTISSLNFKGSGTVSSISTNQLEITNVLGKFELDSKVIGLESGSTAKVNTSSGSVQINDKSSNIFNTTVQLSRLIGNFTSGSSEFEEDEFISQSSLISYAQPQAYLHHSDIQGGTDDDTLYVSNLRGIFNLDSSSTRTITGNNSLATLDNLSNKYNGDFVKDSGSVIYYENLDAITRSDNKSETIKVIFEF